MSSASLAALSVDTTFAAFGCPAVYRTPDRASETPVTAIVSQPDSGIGAAQSLRAFGRAVTIELRAAEVAKPEKNGIVARTDTGEEFRIVSDPKSEDPERLVFTMTGSPA